MASTVARHSWLGRIDRKFFLIIFFDFWRRCAARRQKSKKMPSLIFSTVARHSCRRFPHVRKKNTPKKNRGAIFFWRRPLRVTARLDESTGPRTSQLSPLPTPQSFFTPRKSRSDFFWRQGLRVTARLDESTVPR